MCDVEITTSKFSIVIDNKNTRKNMKYIRIGTKSSSSYLKTTTQYNHHIFPRIIKMRQLSHIFLKLRQADILETINSYVNESVTVPVILKNAPSNCSKSTSTSYDNPLILQSMYPILDKLNINTSNLDDKPLDLIFLKNLLSEVSCVLIYNNININLEEWGGKEK